MKKLLSLFLVLILVFLSIYAYGFQETSTRADLLVFGAPPKEDGSLGSTLESRLIKAKQYLLVHEEARAILLGGGSPLSEAQAMADYLVEAGVSKDRLILEENSSSTWTNLIEARQLMEELGIDKALALSSDYHMLRIRFLAKRLDMELYPLPAKTPAGVLIPSYGREVLALIKSFFLDR